MISFALTHISWVMVVVAAVIGFVIGMLWYAPMFFGEAWQRLSGIRVDQNTRMMPLLVSEFITMLLQAYALAWFLERAQALNFVDAITVAAMISILFIGSIQWAGIMWSGKPRELFFIYQGNTLVMYVMMAILFAYVAV